MFRIVLLVLCCLFQLSCMPIGQPTIETLSTDTSTILEPPKAKIEQGRLSGLWQETDEDLLAVFRGVPFAAPPLGRLRWAAPADPVLWADEKDATEFGAQCMQSSSLSLFTESVIRGQGLPDSEAQAVMSALASNTPPPMSEDCLFLNLTTPNMAPAKNLPVMVWFHGGSHQTGAASSPTYQSTKLPQQGIVLVTANYRLGPFGYLAHPALSANDPNGVSSNYGILDQIAALRWIQDNIAAFGGDPNNVTIFGESAGAQAVSELMASPLADGLYHKAIMQSGVYSWHPIGLKRGFRGIPSAEVIGQSFFALNGLATMTASAQELRAISSDAILNAAISDRRFLGAFLPVADGYVQPDRVLNLILDEKTAPVPILLGYNADEGSLFYQWYQRATRMNHEFPSELPARLARFREVFSDDSEVLIKAYGLDDPERYKSGEADMLGDDSYGVHTRLLADAHAMRELPVYVYQFRRTPPRVGQTAGAHHAAEIPFVFDTHYLELNWAGKRLTDTMVAYWTNFAKYGNPNSDTIPEWPAYDTKTKRWMILDNEISVEADVRKEKLDAIENTYLGIMGRR
jgi:para-nitrobenzyl esterase